MKKLLPGVFVIALAAGCLWFWRNSLLERVLEGVLNPLQAEYFGGTLNFSGVRLPSDLKLRVDRLTGELKGSGKDFPFEVRDILFADPLTHFVIGKPLTLTFSSFRPLGSEHEGASGKAVLLLDSNGTVELEANVLALHLEEIEALDPESLKDATGRLSGTLLMRTGLKGTEFFDLDLRVRRPGGRIQSRFFEILLPYLPAVDKAVLSRLSRAGTGTVDYTEADLRITHPASESINIRLHILVPEYSLNLNLNVTLRVESEEVFLELARLSGLIKAEPL